MRTRSLYSFRWLRAGFLVGAITTGHLVHAAGAASSDADQAWSQLKALQKLDAPFTVGPTTLEAARLAWISGHTDLVQFAARAFYRNFPQDPRRWDAVVIMAYDAPSFFAGFTPDVTKPMKDVQGLAFIEDREAMRAWRREWEQLRQALLAAKDAGPEQRIYADGYPVWEVLWEGMRQQRANPAVFPAAWETYPNSLAEFAAKYPENPMTFRLGRFVQMVEASFPERVESILATFTASPNESLRTFAAERLRTIALLKKPLEIKFTAVDGRPVDLNNLRGKVVLIDFWATWCGPCKEEIPNVKKVYAAYHDRGFEIIGIALENANLAANDTPAQHEQKMAKAEKVLRDFVSEHDMPWPQYFDGKFWKNDIGATYMIRSIPAMFLLGKDGKVISTNARGAALEAAVKKQLGV